VVTGNPRQCHTAGVAFDEISALQARLLQLRSAILVLERGFCASFPILARAVRKLY
jgi:hypothetical protein